MSEISYIYDYTTANTYNCLVNHTHRLCSRYVPDDLTAVDFAFDCSTDTDCAASLHSEKRMLRREAALWCRRLFEAAAVNQISLYGISGYRSYARQKELYQTGQNPSIAPPGASEHQLGLALDVSTPETGLRLEEAFADTAAGKWLRIHAPIYGFILRYPAHKESITGIPYEPWHIRYVTKSLALYLTLTDMTLEEYHAIGQQS